MTDQVDEIELHLQIDRAARAKRLLEDDILKEAFAKLEEAYIKKWRESDVNDTDNRERLFLAVNMIGKVQSHLVKVVQNGSIAQRTINDIQERRDRGGKVVNINF